jgi:hypothetical protein
MVSFVGSLLRNVGGTWRNPVGGDASFKDKAVTQMSVHGLDVLLVLSAGRRAQGLERIMKGVDRQGRERML